MSSQLSELTGAVKRITFHNPANGWTVLRLLIQGYSDEVTAVGSFGAITPGENLRLTGHWVNDATYGQQFRVTGYEVVRPATLAGIQRYLGSGLIKGIGPIMARRIVERFGLETLDIIEKQPHRLLEVEGISKVRIEKICAAWQEQKEIRNVMTFLTAHNISTNFAVKLFKQYGRDTISIVESNPYRLARDIYGIGFKSADQIALKLGLARDSDERLRAGITHTLYEATEDGHCFLPLEELLQYTCETLEVDLKDRLRLLVDEQVKSKELFRVDVEEHKEAIYVAPFFLAERATGMRLLDFTHPVATDRGRVLAWLERFCQCEQIRLSEEQSEAILTAVSSGVSIITGGPGCGKTTTLKALVKLLTAMGKRVQLASPTGRAAQRLSEVTGLEAKTIHRMLEFEPTTMSFKHNQDNPLRGDFFIIDEASMIDILLANNLLKAIPPEAQICFVGDADQLPSVGAGQFLNDMINSRQVALARLTRVFRQAATSFIISHAHEINTGRMPSFTRPGERTADCYFIEEQNPERINALLVKVVTSSIPRHFKIDPREVQVLAPMKRGSIGTNNLNLMLQGAINPPAPDKPELKWGLTTFRLGDKVIQQVNNYQLEVFNGDIGYISGVYPEERRITISFNTREVEYEYADLNEIALAYAISIHRSQGSEYAAVVMPVHYQHWNLLNRAILYTGLTRAKRLAILVGQSSAVHRAVTTDASTRYTNLAAILTYGKANSGRGTLW